jgi:phenylalanine-4-hydroxylase
MQTRTPSALSDAPTTHGLRGDYSAMAADWTVAQSAERYTAEEHALWRTLYARQMGLIGDYAASQFLAGARAMDCGEAIPSMEALSLRLRRATGWEIVAVPGLVPNDVFFAHLANKRFPASVWLRTPEEIDYLVEPDIFHDLFGHVPMLFDPVFANYLQRYGQAGPKAIAHDAVDVLARLYWAMVEFGLIIEDGVLKAYGAGMLSSFEETRYSIESPIPHRARFALQRVMRQTYAIDRFQATYFVLDSFQQLFEASEPDFGPLYDALKDLPSIAPGEIADGDAIIAPDTRAIIPPART